MAVPAGCDPGLQPSSTKTVGSGDGVPRFADTARGDARFAQHVLGGRVRRIVDVTGSYLDPHHVVASAFVLVDSTFGRRWAPEDHAHRPVVVRYTSAARPAVRGHDRRSYGLRGSTLLWVPAGLPARLARDYQQAMSAGLG